MTGLYDYKTPAGFGDTFFQYVYDLQNAGLTDGQTYLQLGVAVNDGQFVLRKWGGLGGVAQGLQIYDWLGRRFAADFMNIGLAGQGLGRGQMGITPEVVYPDNGNIRFDLSSVIRSLIGTIGGIDTYSSQLVFSGVRRRRDVISDPVPSEYRYKEVDFEFPYSLTITNPAATAGAPAPLQRIQIPVTDYDFELRRCILGINNGGFNFSGNSPFKITLYDTNRVQVSNIPVLSNELFYLNPVVVAGNGSMPNMSAGQLSFNPAPPMLYRVNSVIQFDVYSLLTAAQVPQTFQLTFKGIRRIPC